MFAHLGQRLTAVGRMLLQRLSRRLLAATKPSAIPLAVGTLADLPRNKRALIAENALLRHQLVILRRGVKRPRCTPMDRALLVLLASRAGVAAGPGHRAARHAAALAPAALPPRVASSLPG